LICGVSRDIEYAKIAYKTYKKTQSYDVLNIQDVYQLMGHNLCEEMEGEDVIKIVMAKRTA